MKAIVCVVLLCVGVSLAATGWFKAHADLKNTGVHPFAKGIRSLSGTNWNLKEDSNQKYYEGGVAFDEDGTGYVMGDVTYAVKVNTAGDYVGSADNTNGEVWGATLVLGSKVYCVGEENLFTTDKNFDNTTVPHISDDAINGAWRLYGAGASYWTASNGIKKILLINGDGKLAIFNTTGDMIETLDYPSGFPGTQVNEYATPAVDGDVVYWATYKNSFGGTSAVFSYNMATQAYNYVLLNTSFTGLGSNLRTEGSVMIVGDKLYLNSPAGYVVCLGKDLTFVWAVQPQGNNNGDSYYMNIAKNPLDGTILFQDSDSNAGKMSLWKLNPATGATISHVEMNDTDALPTGYYTSWSASGPVVSADGIAYVTNNVCDGAVCAVAYYGVDLSTMKMLWATVGNDTMDHEIDLSSVSIGHDGSVAAVDDSNGFLMRFGCPFGTAIGNSGICGEESVATSVVVNALVSVVAIAFALL